MPGFTQAGQFVLDDVEFKYNNVDLSNRVRSVSFPLTRTEIEVSAMGDGWAKFLLGRGESSFTVEFYQDLYTAQVHATLSPDVITPPVGGRTVTLMNDKSLAVATTNPRATFSAKIVNYPFIDGAYNEAASISVDFRMHGAPTFATS